MAFSTHRPGAHTSLAKIDQPGACAGFLRATQDTSHAATGLPAQTSFPAVARARSCVRRPICRATVGNALSGGSGSGRPCMPIARPHMPLQPLRLQRLLQAQHATPTAAAAQGVTVYRVHTRQPRCHVSGAQPPQEHKQLTHDSLSVHLLHTGLTRAWRCRRQHPADRWPRKHRSS